MLVLRINLAAEFVRKGERGILNKVWAKRSKRRRCRRFWNGGWRSMGMIIRIKVILSICRRKIILASWI
jgi:hypothetical protein